MPEARIKARVDADASSVGRELNKASAQASAFASKMRGIGKGLAGAFTIGAVGSLAKSLLGDSDRLADLAANVGLTTDELQAFEATALMAGTSSDKLGRSLEKLAQVQGDIVAGAGEKALESLAALGLSAEEAQLPVGQLFAKIAEGFTKTGNVGALDELFGRGAVQLTNTLKEIGGAGGLDKLIEYQRLSGNILSASELSQQATLNDRAAAMAKKAGKFVGAVFTPGAEDQTAIENQKAAIASQQANARRIAEEARAAQEAEKRAELEKIISGAKGETGLGSELVRIGAHGGIRAPENEAVRTARQQLEVLKKVETNTRAEPPITPGTF